MTYTDDQIATIKRMKGSNQTWKSIGLALNKKPAAVMKWWRRNHLYFDLPPKSNVSKKITDGRVGLLIKRICQDNPTLPIRDYEASIREQLGPTSVVPCRETIRQYLLCNGLKLVELSKKPFISSINQQKRLEFAREWLPKVDLLRTGTIWSDETTVRKQPAGRKLQFRVHQSIKREDLPSNAQIQQGGFGVMFWGCFSYLGRGPLVVVPGTQNQDTYKEMLLEELLPEIKHVREEFGTELLFMQDNAPCHKAASVTDFLTRNRIETIKWPPSSPDLNPIENLWSIIKMRRQKKFGIPHSKQELIEQVQDIWLSLELDTLRNLCNSIEKRLRQCIERNGKPTDY